MTSLFTASAVLATKIGIVHLLTVRSRIMSGALVQSSDDKNYLVPPLKVILGCYGSDFGGVTFVERGERIAKNCAENEPFFIGLATAAGLSAVVPFGIGIDLIYAFTIFRCLHTGIYLVGDKVNSAFRAASWVGALACTLGMVAVGVGSKGETE